MTARDDLPPRETILVDEHWRVCHAFDSALLGWLVVLPKRHVTAIHELTRDEMAGLGPLIRKLSIALRAVVGCEKTYVMQFAESPEHLHVHFHVVPRMAEFTDEQRGPNVFTFLGVPETEQVSPEEMDRIAQAIRSTVNGA
jgi:diadenosine tetraphosphate (Ap4A) HIT family hydrolase